MTIANLITMIKHRLQHQPLLENEILKVKLPHIFVAFLVSLIIPALWAGLEWNAYQFHLFRNGESTFGLYLAYLQNRFLVIYTFSLFLALIFGTPAFYALRKRVPFKLSIVCLIAAAIAILPNILIELFRFSSGASSNSSYRVGDCTIIENGHRTLCGWQHFLTDNIFVVALQGTLAGGIFWAIVTKILKNLQHLTAQDRSNAEYKRLLGQAVEKVRQDTSERKIASSRYTDEDFFNAILNLPDYSFKLVASKIRFPDAFDQDRGMRWSIQPDHVETVQKDTEPLRTMGLIYWNNTSGHVYMNFELHLLASRLAARVDLIEKLKDSAQNRGIKLIP